MKKILSEALSFAKDSWPFLAIIVMQIWLVGYLFKALEKSRANELEMSKRLSHQVSKP